MDDPKKVKAKEIYTSILSSLLTFSTDVIDNVADKFFDLQLVTSSLKGCAESIIVEKSSGDMITFFTAEVEKFKEILTDIGEAVLKELQIKNKEFLQECNKILDQEYGVSDVDWAKKIHKNLTQQINFFFKGLFEVTRIAETMLRFYTRIKLIVSRSNSADKKNQSTIDMWNHEMSKEMNEGMKIIKDLRGNLKKIQKFVKQ